MASYWFRAACNTATTASETSMRDSLRGTVAPRIGPKLSRGGDTEVSWSRVVPDSFARTAKTPTLSEKKMTSRHEKERAKQIQEKCQNLLTQMLRDEDNKYCVDCDAKGSFSTWMLVFHRSSLGDNLATPVNLFHSLFRIVRRSSFRARLIDIDHGTIRATRHVPHNAPRRHYGFLISA